MEMLTWTLCAEAEGKKHTFSGQEAVANPLLTLDMEWREDACGRVLTVTLTPKKPVTLRLLRFSMPFDLQKGDRVFLNGYQSWTDSFETPVGQKMRGVRHIPAFLMKRYAFDRYGDYRFARYPAPHGFTYVYRRRGDSFLLAASLKEETGFTVFYPDAARRLLRVEKDCAGLRLSPGEPYAAFQLAFLSGDEDAVFDRWFALLGIRPPAPAPRRGYTSWYQHYQNISEELLRKTLDRAPQDWEIFQIDDGWETAVGDWLEPDAAKFPHGLHTLAKTALAKGMTPGLWLAPFAAQKNSALVREHPDWLLREENGDPVLCGGNWGGFYALDFYCPAVRDYLRRVFQTVIHDWGFRLLKLDFLYAVCMLSRPDKTRAGILFEAMDFLRECAKDALLLGCGVPLAAAFGKVDYCRVGTDVSLGYDDAPFMRLLHRERISTKNSLQNTVWRRQLNGRAFWNDPDVFLLRDERQSMSRAQRMALAAANAQFGGLLLTSDDPADYTPEQRAVLRQIDVVQGTRARAVTGRPGEIGWVDAAGQSRTLRLRDGRLLPKAHAAEKKP